eukprot:CAMPEP_0175325480 /NCGR_PEP_ID=MMETSP0093-20121207/74032_1 /TAXON_ID=311494 /ORGANISM="Alexandrium monilatum, Strain CCMP3105" /LENGTH=67 /DNA_ID=CAMNT_0016622441 /DNA_START=129 /DNA_END=332 /DNA_ORIENTATION=+
MRSAGSLFRRTWSKLVSAARAVQEAPHEIRLHDVIVEWKAKRAMEGWSNHAAGSNYVVEECESGMET